MSTKSTIEKSRTWHLYQDVVDGSIQLELNDAKDSEIKVSGRWHAVIVTLPDDVLKAICDHFSSQS